jgi:hypothetical protein
MAHLHQHAGQKHINFGSIGQKIKMFGEVAASMKGIVETGIFLKNALTPVVAGVAALAVV